MLVQLAKGEALEPSGKASAALELRKGVLAVQYRDGVLRLRAPYKGSMPKVRMVAEGGPALLAIS